MKHIADAIKDVVDNTGCHVVAWLPGKKYGGAFSAAAILAMACEKIYISPSASMGAIGPVQSAAISDEEYTKYIATYSPDILSTFSLYAASLANLRNRPELLARALIDKRLAIAEVRDSDGKRSLVEASRRLEDQSIVRMITEGLSTEPSGASSADEAFRSIGKLLNLSSTDAIRWKLADKEVESIQQVREDLGLGASQSVNVEGINNTIRRFVNARNNLEQLLMKIQWQEDRVAFLEEQMLEMEKLARMGVPTIGYNQDRNRVTARDVERARNPRLWDRYRDERDYSGVPRTRDYWRRGKRLIVSRPDPYIHQGSIGNIQQVRMELLTILSEMIGNYQRAINQALRWPGALPPELSQETLKKNHSSAEILFRGIQQMFMLGY